MPARQLVDSWGTAFVKVDNGRLDLNIAALRARTGQRDLFLGRFDLFDLPITLHLESRALEPQTESRVSFGRLHAPPAARG